MTFLPIARTVFCAVASFGVVSRATRADLDGRWQVRGRLNSATSPTVPPLHCAMEAASLTMREARGEFTASLHCADAEGEDVFTVPLRMSVSNVQRHEATFVFDVTDKASSFIDGRINGTVRDANALDGFMSIRLSLPDMDDVVVAGRWSGARLA